MKIYLATADVAQVSRAAGLRLIDGVSTSPQLLHDAGGVTDPRGLIQDLCRAVPGPVIASVESIHADEIYRDGRELARLSDQVVVEIPLVEDGMQAISRLSAEGIRVAASLVFSATQAILAARAGASMVSCAIQELDRAGIDGIGVVEEIGEAFHLTGRECDVLASVADSSSSFARCIRAGADGILVGPEVLRSLLLHPLTDRGMDRVLTTLSRLPKGRLTNG